MSLKTKLSVLLILVAVLSSFAASYEYTSNVEVYRGETVELDSYRLSYVTMPEDRLKIAVQRPDSNYILEQTAVNDLYGRDKPFRYPEYGFSVEFLGQDWSDEGTYLNLSVSSAKNVFTGASLEADVPDRVIAARGDDITVPLTLTNEGTRNHTYRLSSNTTEGIEVSYSYQDFNVSRAEVPAGETRDVTAEIDVLESAAVGMTEVTFRADNATESIDLEVRGDERSQEIDFQLDENYIVAWPGKEFSISAELRNMGEAPVENMEVEVETPDGWSIERNRVRDTPVLEGRRTMRPYYRVSVPSNVEAGDYYITIDPKSENLDPEPKEIRVHVRTRSGLSYIGVVLIVLSLIGMALTYWKLGRR